jgi:hypothetical protein
VSIRFCFDQIVYKASASARPLLLATSATVEQGWSRPAFVLAQVRVAEVARVASSV